MAKPIIVATNISKRYALGQFNAQTMREEVELFFERVRRKMTGAAANAAGTSNHDFWALKDVSFDVQPGEVLGIIGRNGAGKSTLLKILSRITEPTGGEVRVRGRIASLLEVGTGFHPELTGRENVYLNGTILGMKRAEVKAKFDEIVAFAGTEKFIDTPVKRYSSGMYVRLAFAVAAHLEPEILIIDEVLAVGDAEFQKKCLGKMQEVSTAGRTVLFVSHSMPAIQRLCTRVLWLDAGAIRNCGAPQSICEEYLSCDMEDGRPYIEFSRTHVAHPSGMRFVSLAVTNDSSTLTTKFRADEHIKVRVDYEVDTVLPETVVDINVFQLDGSYLWSMNDCDVFPELYASRRPGAWRYECSIPPDLLSPGRYLLGLGGGTPREFFDAGIRIPIEISPAGFWKPSYLNFGVGGGPMAVRMIASRPKPISPQEPCEKSEAPRGA